RGPAAVRRIRDRAGVLRPEFHYVELADVVRLQPRRCAARLEMAARREQEVPHAGARHLGCGDHRLHPSPGTVPGAGGLLDRGLDLRHRAVRLLRDPGAAGVDLPQALDAWTLEPRALLADRRL